MRSTGRDVCDDCGQPATVATSRVCLNSDGTQREPEEHHYCRPCAERHGVPPRRPRPARGEREPTDWEKHRQFWATYERIAERDPSARAELREYARMFRLASEHRNETVPDDIRTTIARLLDEGT